MTDSDRSIKALLIELCSEDDWGSWELWWNVSAGVSTQQLTNLKRTFLDVIGELVATGKLIPKHHYADGHFEAATFDREKLSKELEFPNKPDPDSCFWFGCR